MPRIAFIGCGHHASNNLYPALRYADCELVAACDLWDNNRALAKRAFGAQRVYEHYEPLLANEQCDGVIICGPASLHYEAAKACLQKGLPVLVEKPPAETLAQMIELRQLARENKAALHVAFMKRFARYYRTAKAITERPEFGAIAHVMIRYSYGIKLDPTRTLSLMAIHALDLMRFFLGNPTQVHVCHADFEGHNSYTLQFCFQSGATATVVLNATAPTPIERLEITGKGAFLSVNELTELNYYPPQANPWAPPVGERYAPNSTLQTFENASTEIQGYAGEIAAFMNTLNGQLSPTLATADDAVAAMRLIEIIAQAANHATIALPDLIS